MFFYDFVVILVYLVVCSVRCVAMGSRKLVVLNKGVEDVSPDSVALQFFVLVNNTGKQDLESRLRPRRCCLDVGKRLDCDVVVAIGDSVKNVPAGTSKCLKLVAPLLDQFDRKGYCIAEIDFKTSGRSTRATRHMVRIPFDTRLKSLDPKKLPIAIKRCDEVDRDPLNGCQPVNCLRYYNGRKSYFNKMLGKCEEVPPCINDGPSEMPKNIYDPIKNECVNDNPISREDIGFLKALVHGERTPKEIMIIKSYKTPAVGSTIPPDSTSTGTGLHKAKSEADSPQAAPVITKTQHLYKTGDSFFVRKAVVDYFSQNRCALTFLILILVLQCGLLSTMTYIFTQKCLCCQRRKLIRKYFNYRQDASVTTPLIATSNIETETTDYQYFSESSNVDKILRTYKACQRETDNYMKVSLSDDILSKCLNRRDWRRESVKSEGVTDYATKVYKKPEITEKTSPKQANKLKENISKPEETRNVDADKQRQPVVHLDMEKETSVKDKASKKEIKAKNSVDKSERSSKKSRKSRAHPKDSEIVYSEQEIKCHSYNYMEEGSNFNRRSSQDLTGFKPTQDHDLVYVDMQRNSLTSISTEKSAQASFSKDSIDDLLSEHGMLFLAGENMRSKYSFTTDTNSKTDSKSVSSMSGKTSKNNIERNVFSMLQRKSKSRTSDPGVGTSKESMDLEVLHIMPGSGFSSTNESDCLKGLKTKKSKGSRTSM